MIKETPFLDMFAFVIACCILYAIFVVWLNVDIRILAIMVLVNTNQIYSKLSKIGARGL